MGKRRIRCLQALQVTAIHGFDLRADRTAETGKLYHVPVHCDFGEAVAASKPDAVVISVPPDIHHRYMAWAVEHRVPFFVEASVVDDGMAELINRVKVSGILAAPSATMMFHPAIKLVRDIVKSGELGKISNIVLHSGQYLPDWHTYEKVSEYYVSNQATGGAREIVPFELTWFTMVFGFPRRVAANYRKTIAIEGADYIDDTYNCLLDYGAFLAVITVDVVSRCATRRLVINGARKQLCWSWDENCVKVFDPQTKAWEPRAYVMASAQKGYNANIGENMYIDELRSFLDAVQGKAPFINSMENDHAVLRLLYQLERSDRLAQYVEGQQ